MFQTLLTEKNMQLSLNRLDGGILELGHSTLTIFSSLSSILFGSELC